MFKFKRTVLLCAAFFILGAGSALLLESRLSFVAACASKASAAASTIPPLASPSPLAPLPPCGKIESVEIPLANPDGMFPDREQRLANPSWFFENFTEGRLTRFLSSCDLRPMEQRILLDKRAWKITSNGISISPPEELIWSLRPQSRQQIYSTLARSQTNFPQCFPFRFTLAGFDLRFNHSDLPVAQIEKVRRLSYTNSDYLCFTDLQAMKLILTADQFNDLIETLYQLPTYLLKVVVTPDSDINGLIKYWGKGGREKRIAPLLNSLAKAPGGATLNISYLLPTFARLRLYTYPYTWNDPIYSKQDCFFTSMNFFNAAPNTNFFDRAYTSNVLHTDYVPVETGPTFGDVVALSNAAGEIFHTCVYIAEDFVFTKNGVDPEQPWVLMKMADMMMLYYPSDHPGHITFLRRKEMT